MPYVYVIKGLHCGGCAEKAQAALRQAGYDATVTYSPARVTIAGNTEPHLDDLNELVGEVGDYHVEKNDSRGKHFDWTPVKAWLATYRPLLLIAGYIAVVALAGGGGGMGWMERFMAGFFLVFSFFKLLNLGAFAAAYANYDLLAARWKPWGYVYPFVELGLGLMYAFHVNPALTNTLTLVIMGFSALGVIKVVKEGRKLECACLGTVFKLPMSTVTIIEDVGMAGMALGMLLMMR